VSALIRVGLVFLFLLVVLWRKVGVGKAIFLCAFVLGLLFLIPPLQFLKAVGKGLASWETLLFLCLLVGIRLFGWLLKQVGSLDKVVGSLEDLTGDSRSVVTLIPAFVGLLPMPGGALLSAHMMDDAGTNMGLSGERKAAVNFWFRHVWESVFPLYPGIVVIAALLDVPLGKVILTFAPITLSMIAAGLVIYLPALPAGRTTQRENISRRGALSVLFQGIWPVVAVIVLTALVRLTVVKRWGSATEALVLSVLFMLVVVMLVHRVNPKKIGAILREKATIELVWLAFGIMVFRRVMEASGAVEVIPMYLTGRGVNVATVLFAVPLGVGILTGNTVAFVASTFPLLSGLMMPEGAIDYRLLYLAFAGGFVGMLLSPVHLCLALTKDYFKAELGRIYAVMAPGIATVLAVSAAVYIWGGKWLDKL
jgi:integral membrane protein (TIGR00529 family)